MTDLVLCLLQYGSRDSQVQVFGFATFFSLLSHAELTRALIRISSIAKPKILDAYACFASMMQRYENFSIYARK